MITGARKTWGWALPSGASLYSQVDLFHFFFLINKNKTRKKRSSLGEKELLCSLQLPSLELVGGTVPREAEGEHQGGVQLVLSGPQECLWSGSRSWLQLLSHGSSVSQGLKCVPIWRACLGLLSFVFLYMRVHVHVYPCLCRWVCCWVWVRAYTYISVCVSMCVSVCACVFVDLGGREPGDRLCSGLELYPGSGV